MTSSAFVKRGVLWILASLLLAAPFLLTCWVHGDGIGYVAILRSAVVDHDLELGDELAHLSSSIEADAGGLPARLMRRGAARPGLDPVFQQPRTDPATGHVIAAYSVGPALAWAPLYLLAHALTRLVHGAAAATGYGGLYWLAIAVGSLAFGALGVTLAFRWAAGIAPPREALWAALTVAWATPLVYYLYLAPSYSHALTALTAGAFFALWWRTRGAARARTWFLWGVLAGLLFLAHWNDVVLALPVFAVEGARLLRADADARRRLPACALAALAGALLAASPQLAFWQFLHGRPWVRHPVDYVGFAPAGLLGTLFSTRHGLFVWTPAAIPAVIGLFRLARRDRELAAVALAALALLVLSNCLVRDWWGGASFGMRRLVSATPLLVLGLAVALDDARAALARGRAGAARWLAPAAFVAFTGWNLLLVGQYALGMIDHSAAVPLGTLVANQPLVLGRLVHLAGQVLR